MASLALALLLLPYAPLPYSSAAVKVTMEEVLPVTGTGCTKCKDSNPPVTKCTNCEMPMRAKSQINHNCGDTLTCAPGRILIANNRFVVTDVQCSHHASDGEIEWVGTTSDMKRIAIENAACFITPISCISLGSFSTRCPRGYICDKVKLSPDQTRVSCHIPGKWQWFRDLLSLNVNRKNLWYRDSNGEWKDLKEDLWCDPKIGSWIETVPAKTGDPPRSIITDRLFCGKKEFSLFGLIIDEVNARHCVRVIQLCLAILLVTTILIIRQLRKRAFLRSTKKYLDEQYKEGKERLKKMKEEETIKVRTLISRWREVNRFVVEKNKPIVLEYLKNRRGKKRD